MYAVETKDLVKKYKNKTAVDSVNLNVKKANFSRFLE